MSEDVTWQSCTPPSAADQDMGRTMIGPVFRSDAAKQKQRRQPCCGFCRNHDLEVPVINHHCDYAKCTCALCELTRRRRLVMCHQQRLWRYKKNNARQKDGEEHSSEDEVSPTASFPQEEQLDLLDPALNRPRRKMVCDKCRNHNLVAKKRGHKGSCPFEDCTCDLCNFTIKRQQLMKHQQRVRRSQIIGPSENNERSQSQPLTNTDSPDGDLQPMEDDTSTSPPIASPEEGNEKETEATKSPFPVASLEMQPTAEWTSAMKENAIEDVPPPQDNQFYPVTTNTCQPPPLQPISNYQLPSDIHSSLTFNKNEHNLNSAPCIEDPGNTRLSMRCGCFGQLQHASAASTTLPSPPSYGLDIRHQRFVPWTGRVSEESERCIVEANNNVRPQVPFRPQPIPAARPPRPQNDWQFIGFPYSPASMLQSVQQPSPLSVCDNFRSQHHQAGLEEQWHRTRAPHPMESNGVHSSYSAGLPYFASALLHPSAKPSLSLMPTSRNLFEYSSQLPGFRQRDQYQVNPLGAFTRSCNNVMI